jgi:predicted RecA/RadA family phage recombinase
VRFLIAVSGKSGEFILTGNIFGAGTSLQKGKELSMIHNGLFLLYYYPAIVSVAMKFDLKALYEQSLY